MTAKPLVWATLLSLLLTGIGRAQPMGSGAPERLAYPMAPGPATTSPQPLYGPPMHAPPANGGANWSNGLSGLRIGRDGPIGQEVYVNFGPTLPVSGGTLAENMKTGWMVEVGARGLFFNPRNDAAWVLRTGLGAQYNRGESPAAPFDYFGFPTTVRDVMRWSWNNAIGRDWIFHGAAPFGNGQANFRVGADVTGRFGNIDTNLNVDFGAPDPVDNYQRRGDIYGGIGLGFHGLFEVPMGAWVFFGGFRAEYNYNWSDLLVTQNSNIHDVNLLLSFGFRY